MIYTSEKTLDELKDKVSEDEKSDIEKLVSELRELINGDDITAIKRKDWRINQQSSRNWY